MQFELQCFDAFESATHNHILYESPKVKVIFDTQIPEQTRLWQGTGNRKKGGNHVGSSVIARLVSDSNKKNVDKELVIFHINNAVREIAIKNKIYSTTSMKSYWYR